MPKKILLADDSITIQKVVELTFSDGDYEVTAVNNGSKAIQKLSEMRPDIILSDIIMPEKNGYEVCEFVKSHPDYRSIPVVLLTGTFEPFDPDRADKAGCDAVVTKPFESQSLIQKVDELIEQGRSKAPTAPGKALESPAPPAARESPWSDEAPTAPARVPFSFAPAPPPTPPPTPPPAAEAFTHESEVFGAAQPPSRPTTEMPFETAEPSAFSGETRAIPKVSYEEMRQQVSTQAFPPPGTTPEPPPPPEPPSFSGETRAFPKMSFEDFPAPAKAPTPTPEPAPRAEESPFGAPPPAESFSGETRAFPKMTFDDLEKAAAAPSPAAPSTSSLWDEQPPRPTPAWSPPPEKREELREREVESAAAAPAPAGGERMELTEEQIDRIARRVVQLMSDQVIRNIAWEVIPDLAEMVVKERIRQLEGE